MTDFEKTDPIRSLNDQLRTRFEGGRIFITQGLAALPELKVARVLRAVATFSSFTEENDPHGEHDCAVIEVNGDSYIWKIDYYDPTLSFLSEDPADPEKTARVLTIMRSDEY